MEMDSSAPSCTEGRSQETRPLLVGWVHLPAFSEGHPQAVVHPAEESWSPRQMREQSSFSPTAALTVLWELSGIRSWRIAEWSRFGTDLQESPCYIEGNVSHCTHKYLWFQLHFFPKQAHYFLTPFAAYWFAIAYRLPSGASDSRAHYTSFCSHFISLSPLLLCAWHFQLPCSRQFGPEGNPNPTSVLGAWH